MCHQSSQNFCTHKPCFHWPGYIFGWFFELNYWSKTLWEWGLELTWNSLDLWSSYPSSLSSSDSIIIMVNSKDIKVPCNKQTECFNPFKISRSATVNTSSATSISNTTRTISISRTSRHQPHAHRYHSGTNVRTYQYYQEFIIIYNIYYYELLIL